MSFSVFSDRSRAFLICWDSLAENESHRKFREWNLKLKLKNGILSSGISIPELLLEI